MNQVEYNARHALYAAELKRIAAKYRAECESGVLADMDAEIERLEEIESREEAETDACRGRFFADTAGFKTK